MVSKPDLSRQKAPVEQVILRSDQVFLCLLINRRHNHIRVIDFRTGNFPVKRVFIQSLAQRERAHKVFTLVERDEVPGWLRLGFQKEGTVPGYYKRSDAFVLGRVLHDPQPPTSYEVDAKALASAAKKYAKEVSNIDAPAKMRTIDQREALEKVRHVNNGRRPLTSFDPFGRHSLRLYLAVSPDRHSEENVVAAEFQDCFGNARLELLFSPNNGTEASAAITGLRTMMNELQDRGIVTAFATSRTDNELLTALYQAAGFRKTGKMAGQFFDGEKYIDEILWTRKLAVAAADQVAMDGPP